MSEQLSDGRKSRKHPLPIPSHRKLGPADIIKVNALLSTVLIPNADGTIGPDHEGCVAYLPGWTDARVAQEAIPTFEGRAQQVVGSLRVKLYGALRRAPEATKGADPGLVARVEIIKAWLRHLGANLDTFPPPEKLKVVL